MLFTWGSPYGIDEPQTYMVIRQTFQQFRAGNSIKFKFFQKYELMVIETLSLVKVDSQRRIYIPKEIPFKADKAIIVPYGASFLLIPVPEKVIEIDVKASIQELKKRAEEKAREEAAMRMGRHKQG